MTETKRGRILRDTNAGPGVLTINGKQHSFTLDEMWTSDVPPRTGMVVDVMCDEQGTPLTLNAVPEPDSVRGQTGQTPSAFQTRPSMPSQQQATSFLKALFDTSFTTFIVPKLIRLLYVLFMLVGVVVALGAVIAAFNVHSALGVRALLLSPVVFLLVLIHARVTLELIAIVFRIEQNTAQVQPRA